MTGPWERRAQRWAWRLLGLLAWLVIAFAIVAIPLSWTVAP